MWCGVVWCGVVWCDSAVQVHDVRRSAFGSFRRRRPKSALRSHSVLVLFYVYGMPNNLQCCVVRAQGVDGVPGVKDKCTRREGQGLGRCGPPGCTAASTGSSSQVRDMCNTALRHDGAMTLRSISPASEDRH